MKVRQLSLGFILIFAASLNFVNAEEKWVYARTEHFEMFSAAPEFESKSYLNQLEQFDAAFKKVFKISSIGQSRVVVIMFAGQRELAPFAPLFRGKSKPVAAFYQPGTDKDMIVVSAEAQNLGGSDGSSAIFHEYVHKLLHEQGLQLPSWLDEGLAEYFASMKVEKQMVELGRPISRRVQCLAKEKLLPVGQLMTVTHDSPMYNEGEQQHVFYAESWLLVHYLMRDGARDPMASIERFLKSTAEESGEKGLRDAFGMDLAQADAALKNYRSAGKYATRALSLPAGDSAQQISFRPVGAVEHDTMLEDLLWRVRPDEFTPFKLLKLADSNRSASLPWEVLAAHALIADHDRRQAVSFWEQAMECSSDNAYVYLQLAKTQLKYLTSSPSLDYRAPAAVADPIRKLLDRAIELRSDYLEAWESLAQLEAFAEEPRTAVIAQVQKLLPSMRSKSNTMIALAIFQWRNGNLITSRLILEELKNHDSSKAEVLRLMRRLHERLDTTEWRSTSFAATIVFDDPDSGITL
jgi:tetratricopeptide (TPR) repeat protein